MSLSTCDHALSVTCPEVHVVPKPRVDPLYQRKDWRRVVKFWQSRQGLACARCGGAIRMTGQRGPDSLDVGHIIGKHEARQMGWSDDQINRLSNTQPEHSRCGRRAGAEYGNEARGRALPTPVASRDW